MEVILLQDVPALGKSGQKVDVKKGYGRNFLIPQGWAVSATPGAGKQAAAEAAVRLKSIQQQKEKAEGLARQLEQITCMIEVSVGAQGKLHGAVTAADIAEDLTRQGIPVDRHQVEMEKPLTSPGEAQVSVRLHPQVRVSVRVSILSKK